MDNHRNKKLLVVILLSLFLAMGVFHLTQDSAIADVVKLAAITETGGSGPATKLAFDIANKKFEGNIFVDVVSFSWESMVEKTVAELVTKSANFDILDVQTNFGGGTYKYMEDLWPYVKKYGANLDIFPGAFLKQAIYDGKLVGLPFRTGLNDVFAYRKDLYAKYNLKVPRTMEEYYENAKVITKGEKPLGTYGAALMSGSNTGIFEDFCIWFFPQGGRLLNDSQNGVVSFNSPSGQLMIDIFKMWKKMHDEELLPRGHTTWWHTDVLNAMQQNVVAQANLFSPRINALENEQQSKTAGKWGYAGWFRGKAIGPEGHFSVTHSWGINSMVPQQRKEAAFKVLLTMVSEETQKRAAIEKGNGPTIAKTYDDPDYKKLNPVSLVILEGLKKPYAMRGPENQEIITIIGEEGGRAIIGQKTPEDAARSVWSRTEALFKKR